ncbi:MAG: hypothetical protein ABII07_03905 [Patescibacteria group bacterium]|nr:hypothetical protein [Patescibacteria group bacterium]
MKKNPIVLISLVVLIFAGYVFFNECDFYCGVEGEKDTEIAEEVAVDGAEVEEVAEVVIAEEVVVADVPAAPPTFNIVPSNYNDVTYGFSLGIPVAWGDTEEIERNLGDAVLDGVAKTFYWRPVNDVDHFFYLVVVELGRGDVLNGTKTYLAQSSEYEYYYAASATATKCTEYAEAEEGMEAECLVSENVYDENVTAIINSFRVL